MKAAKVKISFDYAGANEARRWLCREAGEHTWQDQAGMPREDYPPGRYACTVCRTVMIVKEVTW